MIYRPRNGRHKPRHRTYNQATNRLESKLEGISNPKVTKRGVLHWWVGGQMWNSKGELVDACIGPYVDEQEAEQVAYEKFEGSPDVFASRYGTTTEANREYRMRRAGRVPLLGDTFERVRHSGEDLGLED